MPCHTQQERNSFLPQIFFWNVLGFMMELHQLCLTLNAFQQSMWMCWVEDRFLDQVEGWFAYINEENFKTCSSSSPSINFFQFLLSFTKIKYSIFLLLHLPCYAMIIHWMISGLKKLSKLKNGETMELVWKA